MKQSRRRKIRELLAAALTLVLFFTSIGPVLAADAAVAETANTEGHTLGNFKDDFGQWIFENGPEFPGAVGAFQQEQETDSNIGTDGYIAKLTGNFTNGGLYVAARRSFDPLDIKELVLRVKTEDSSFVRLRMTDSTGQIHQQKLALTANGHYEEIDVNVFNDGIDYSHWGGANDGIWHAPAKGIVLILERRDLKDNKKIGQIEVSDVTAFSPLPPLRLDQTKLGNIFVQGEQPIIKAVTAGDAISWRATDFWGTPASEGTISTPDGTASITLPVTANGYYSLQVTALQNGVQLAAEETSFALLDPFDITQFSDSPFGLATHFGQTWNTDLVSLISRMGAKSIRDEIYWSTVEKTQGQYEFLSKHDMYMNAVEQNGIHPFIVLSYGNPFYDGGKTPYSDAGRDGFAKYGNAILDHYPNQMDWVEVYNEFNHWDIGDTPQSNAEYYFKLLKETYEQVKSKHPDVAIVGPATAGAETSWIEELFKFGGLQYLDAVSIHPYRYPHSPEELLVSDLDKVQNVIKKYNNQQTKPIWFSELGWPSNQGPEGVSEQTQARYLVNSYVLALANGVEKYFWYDFMDDGVLASEREQNFGIIRNSGSKLGKYTPKPAYVTYGVMARELSEASFVQQETPGNSVRSYLFSDHNQDVRVMWSPEPQQITLKASSPITVTDMMGVTQSYTPDGAGTIYLSLSANPVYVRGSLAEVAIGGQYSLSNGEALIGEPIEMKLTVNNTSPAAKPIDATLKIGEFTYPVKVDAGVRGEISITLPPRNEVGIWTVLGELVTNGQVIGRLEAQMEIKRPFTLQAKHQWDEKQNAEFLRVKISNQSEAPQSVDSLAWSIGTGKGNEQLETSVPGRSSIEVLLPLSELDGTHTYDFVLKLYAKQNEILSYNGKVVIPDKAAVTEIPKRTVKMDGMPDEAVDLPVIDIMKEGNNRLSPYNGAADLSGQAWLSWDQQNLYFSARIQDDVFSQTGTGDQIWEGDSIQLALAAGYPGERQERFEYGIALTPEGPQIYSWYAHGRSPGAQNGHLVVKRDDDKQQTVYEFALPWEEISPIDPADGLFSLSFLVNDNDGQGRRGYVEWGSGIGTAKNPALFKPVRLTGAESEPPADTEAPVWPEGSKLSAADVTQTSVRLQWPAAADNVGVAGYRIYVNGSINHDISAENAERTGQDAGAGEGRGEYVIAGLKPGTAYQLAVKAYDAAGNESEELRGSAQTLKEPPAGGNEDKEAPMWPSGSQLTAAEVTETSVKLQWPAAQDNAGVTGYRVYVDGALYGEEGADQAGQVTVTEGVYGRTIEGLTSGTAYQMAVKALDAAGNASKELNTQVTTLPASVVNPPENSGWGGWVLSANADLRLLQVLEAGADNSSGEGNANVSGEGKGKGEKELSLSPAFAAGTFSYSAETGAEQVKLIAVAEDKGSKVTLTAEGDAKILTAGEGTGTETGATDGQRAERSEAVLQATEGADLKLGQGDNVFRVKVRAENGTEKTYTITVHRKAVKVDEGRATSGREVAFSDLAGHWAENAIRQASAAGMVNGYADGTFKPGKAVTRGEFTVMLMKALSGSEAEAEAEAEFEEAAAQAEAGAEAEAEAELSTTFTDQAQIGAWARKAVAQAVQADIVTGYADGSFRPQATITRMEMAAMLARALQLPLPASTAATSYADDAEIPKWARPAALAVQKAGLVQGRSGNKFAPLATASRAEAVVTLVRMMGMHN